MSQIRALISPFKNTDSAGFASAVLLVLTYGLFTYILLSPGVGIDDANITQTYAASLASALEFTFYPGGERVEGSTSLLWTLLNALAFVFPGPAEIYITLMCFVATLFTVRNCWWIGYWTFVKGTRAETSTYTFLFVLTFASIPSFFAWSIWPLMDITIWLSILSAVVLLVVQGVTDDKRNSGGKTAFWLVFSFALLPVCRPEGVAIAVGILSYLVCFAIQKKNGSACRAYLITLVVVIVITTAITVWRLSYLGVPFPNTYYAKISTNLVDQAYQGLNYLRWFAFSDFNLARIVAFFGIIIFMLRRASSQVEFLFGPRGFMVMFSVGTFALYALLGGDHFDSFRFLQPVHIVFVPGIAGGLAYGLVGVEAARLKAAIVKVVTTISVLSIGTFAIDDGNLRYEFYLAEEGRELGERLNRLETVTSISVIPAGGISRTYRAGPIYDLLGLNWSAMAHATDDLSGTHKNHGAFSSAVFWKVRPEIVTPRLRHCNDFAGYPDTFSRSILKGLYDSNRFNREYEKLCHGGVIMFVRRDVSARVVAELTNES